MYPNPQVSFIIDPLGSGKLIKFTHPIDTRTTEQKEAGVQYLLFMPKTRKLRWVNHEK